MRRHDARPGECGRDRPGRIGLAAVAAAVLTLAPIGAGCGDGPVGPGPEATFTQVDRFGLPAINTVFIPSGMKDAYNASAPVDDPAVYRDEVVATLLAFGVEEARANALADALLPDVQPIDVSQPTGFLNGRALADDVITAELGLIFQDNADLNDDHVDANDRPFLATFPYLAEPHL